MIAFETMVREIRCDNAIESVEVIDPQQLNKVMRERYGYHVDQEDRYAGACIPCEASRKSRILIAIDTLYPCYVLAHEFGHVLNRQYGYTVSSRILNMDRVESLVCKMMDVCGYSKRRTIDLVDYFLSPTEIPAVVVEMAINRPDIMESVAKPEYDDLLEKAKTGFLGRGIHNIFSGDERFK